MEGREAVERWYIQIKINKLNEQFKLIKNEETKLGLFLHSIERKIGDFSVLLGKLKGVENRPVITIDGWIKNKGFFNLYELLWFIKRDLRKANDT